MACFDISLPRTLCEEGGFAQNRVTGEVVNYGITVWTLRDLEYLPNQAALEATPAEIDFVRHMTLAFATAFYRKHYWGSLDGLESQPLADKAFDLSVNIGQKTALGLLQQASNTLAGMITLKIDGVLGPVTLARLNAQPAVLLLAAYRRFAAERYRTIAAEHQELASDLTGWLARLAA